ncbi:MAG: hypothetical protein AB8G11_26225 [Saprospiraceae bacterium]
MTHEQYSVVRTNMVKTILDLLDKIKERGKNENEKITKVTKIVSPTINVRFKNFYYNYVYTIRIGKLDLAYNFLEIITELLEKKYKMIFRMKNGQGVKKELYNISQEKPIFLNKTILQNEINENDCIILILKPLK